MPQPTKGPRLGGSPAHERLLLANLATALFEHGKIRTTEAKARRVRPLAEKLITKARRGDLAARREVLKTVRDSSVVHVLFTEIGPRYADRPGGYTRITKLEPRKGDNAPMAQIELVEALTVAQSAVGEAERARGTRFAAGRGAAAGAGADAPVETTTSPAAEAAAGAAGADVQGTDAVAGEVDEVATPASDAAGDVVGDMTGGSLTDEGPAGADADEAAAQGDAGDPGTEGADASAPRGDGA